MFRISSKEDRDVSIMRFRIRRSKPVDLEKLLWQNMLSKFSRDFLVEVFYLWLITKGLSLGIRVFFLRKIGFHLCLQNSLDCFNYSNYSIRELAYTTVTCSKLQVKHRRHNCNLQFHDSVMSTCRQIVACSYKC